MAGDDTEGGAKYVIYRICRQAQLPKRSWHALRHTLATHAARLGVTPWTLQSWLGHKRIDETMRYVHLVEERHRPIPADVLGAAGAETDPEARIVAMLGPARAAAQRLTAQNMPRPETKKRETDVYGRSCLSAPISWSFCPFLTISSNT